MDMQSELLMDSTAVPAPCIYYITEVRAAGVRSHLIVEHPAGAPYGTELGQADTEREAMRMVGLVAHAGDTCIVAPLKGERRTIELVGRRVDPLQGAGIQPTDDEAAVVEADTYRLWLSPDACTQGAR